MAQVVINRFMGVNNIADPSDNGIKVGPASINYRLGVGLSKADNVNIDNSYSISVRGGKTKIFTASGVHSFSDDAPGYFVKGSDLCRMVHINADDTIEYETITSSITSGQQYRMNYVAVGDRVYYCNGINKGVVVNGENMPWGIARPGYPSISVIDGGLLRVGKYLVTLSFVRSDGQISGSRHIDQVTIASEGKSIKLYNIGVSNDLAVDKINIYMSEVNGSELFLLASVPNGTAEFIIPDTINMSTPIENFGLIEPPVGDLSTLYNGRVYVSNGNNIYYSAPYKYELFSHEWLPFNSKILMLRSTSSGIFIGTETQIIFLSGNDVDEFKYIVVAEYPMVKYTDVNIKGGKASKTSSVIFTSVRGICTGSDSGEFVNITEDTYVPSISSSGAGLFRQENGVNQYLSVLNNTSPNPEAFSKVSISRDIRQNYNPK